MDGFLLSLIHRLAILLLKEIAKEFFFILVLDIDLLDRGDPPIEPFILDRGGIGITAPEFAHRIFEGGRIFKDGEKIGILIKGAFKISSSVPFATTTL
jgi:hypothetical protein